jgi:hypothetical protein
LIAALARARVSDWPDLVYGVAAPLELESVQASDTPGQVA